MILLARSGGIISLARNVGANRGYTLRILYTLMKGAWNLRSRRRVQGSAGFEGDEEEIRS
jgi:hypothetical protein